jgi:hypothetical protein
MPSDEPVTSATRPERSKRLRSGMRAFGGDADASGAPS